MRWGFKRGGESKSKSDAAEWENRLGAIGLQLDGRDVPLRSLAVSVAGPTTWVTALGLYAGRYGHGWQPLTLHFDGSESAMGITGGEWNWRLGKIGQLLDRDPRPVRNPCLIEIDGGYLITATVAEKRGEIEFWQTATWRTNARA